MDGHDACRKICILSALSYGQHVYPDQVPTEGIRGVTLEDVAYADSFDYKIKLLGRAIRQEGGKVCAFVAPHLVPGENPLACVEDVFNAIAVRGNAVGDTMFYGRGAGKLPTASAVTADITDIAANLGRESHKISWTPAAECDIADIADYSCRSCFIFEDVRCLKSKVEKVFGKLDWFCKVGGRFAFIAGEMTEAEAEAKIAAVDAPFIKKFRLL